MRQNLRWPDSRELFQGAQTEPLFLRIALRGPKNCESQVCRFDAIRANRSHVMKIGGFLRIDSRESPRFALRIAGPSRVKTHLKPISIQDMDKNAFLTQFKGSGNCLLKRALQQSRFSIRQEESEISSRGLSPPWSEIPKRGRTQKHK